jgi:hypothetical protein
MYVYALHSSAGGGDVTIFADDPPSGEQKALYRIDPAELVYQ